MKEKIKEFDSFIEDLTSCKDYVGLNICLFTKDEILYSKVQGDAVFMRRKLFEDDMFCIGSNFKSIFCLAITLSFSDMWNITLKEIFGKTIHHKFYDVKLIDLANHRSGIVDSLCLREWRELQTFSKNPLKTRKQVALKILQQNPNYEPKTKFEYCNLNYGILGAAIEKITGKNYTFLIDKFISDPLNIEIIYGQQYGDGFAEGHNYFPNRSKKIFEPLRKGEFLDPIIEHPAGHAYMNVKSYIKYLQEHLRAHYNESDFITEKAYDLILNSEKEYSLGWKVKGKSLSHSGSFFNQGTWCYLLLEENIGIALCVNSNEELKPAIFKEKFLELFKRPLI